MITNANLETVDNIKQQIHVSLKDILKPEPGAALNFDQDAIIEETIAYVFKDEPVISAGNRYEWYYSLLGKSVSVAQGWKINCSKKINAYDQSRESIISYIEQTYGIHREDY